MVLVIRFCSGFALVFGKILGVGLEYTGCGLGVSIIGYEDSDRFLILGD